MLFTNEMWDGIRLGQVEKNDFFMYVILHCFLCRPSDSTVSVDGSIPGLLRRWHWQPDALTARLDFVHKHVYYIIESVGSPFPHEWGGVGPGVGVVFAETIRSFFNRKIPFYPTPPPLIPLPLPPRLISPLSYLYIKAAFYLYTVFRPGKVHCTYAKKCIAYFCLYNCEYVDYTVCTVEK